jgi:protein RecA
VIVDAEHAVDPDYAEKLGLDTKELMIAQPDTGEQGLEIAEALVRSGAVDVVVIDSVAALVPRAEIEGEMGDSHMGLQARLMSQALRKLTGVTSKSHCVLIFINQIREKIRIVFGNPETTTGGRALKFYASMRIEVRRAESIKSGTDIIGNQVSAKVVKNKLAPPFKKAEFDIIFGKGISVAGNVLDLAVAEKLVAKSGSWYTMGDDKLGQGRDNAVSYIDCHPDLLQRLETEIRQRYGLTVVASSDPASVSTMGCTRIQESKQEHQMELGIILTVVGIPLVWPSGLYRFTGCRPRLSARTLESQAKAAEAITEAKRGPGRSTALRSRHGSSFRKPATKSLLAGATSIAKA